MYFYSCILSCYHCTRVSDKFFFSIFFFSIEGKEGTTEMEVFNFTGDGGVALSMYNTDEVSAKSFNSNCFILFDLTK